MEERWSLMVAVMLQLAYSRLSGAVTYSNTAVHVLVGQYLRVDTTSS